MKRVVSLLPSATEMVCAVGGRELLVGRSHECDFPAGLDAPMLTRPRRELPGPSGAIDRAVREIVADALAVYEIDVDGLRNAAPDVVVTQDLCDVCAVSLSDVTAALRELAARDVEVVTLSPLRLGDVWDDVRRVGAALDFADRGESVACELEARCGAIAARTQGLERPDVLTIEWLDPVMIGGTWMPELVELAGGAALVAKAGEHAPTLDAAALDALDPDVVLLKPCGFDIERTLQETFMLPDGWRAVQGGRTFVADGSAFFNRPGPRLVESLEILSAITHPDACPDLVERHLGDGYRRWT